MKEPAVDRIVPLANEVIAELETAIATHGSDSPEHPCADIALRNVRSWRDSAVAGTLPGSYYPNFAISPSNLTFGRVEDRMYELEKLYVDEIRDFHVPPIT
jgi:hypothetical protein